MCGGGASYPGTSPIDQQPLPPTGPPACLSHTPEGTEDSIQRAGVQSRGHNFYPADPGHFQDIYHFPNLLKPYAAILPDGGKAGHIGKIHAGFHLFGDK